MNWERKYENGKEEQNKSLSYSSVISLSCPGHGHLTYMVLKEGSHRRSRWRSGHSVDVSPLSHVPTAFSSLCCSTPSSSLKEGDPPFSSLSSSVLQTASSLLSLAQSQTGRKELCSLCIIIELVFWGHFPMGMSYHLGVMRKR